VNAYLAALMDKPSLTSGYCALCGETYHTEAHHVVPRSQGGTNGPRIELCGFGNAAGCHGEAHARRLHFRFRDGWEYLRTEVPTKYQAALEMPGWRPVQRDTEHTFW
jgi:5-methylcytosine-specific restriction endonuclease McrA